MFFRNLLFQQINAYCVTSFLQNFPSNHFLHRKLDLVEFSSEGKKGKLIGESIWLNAGEITSDLDLQINDSNYFAFLKSKIHSFYVPASYHEFLCGKSSPIIDKKLNLRGSSISHNSYFAKLGALIYKYISTLDIKPRGFVDVGCGDGALLRYLKSLFPFDNFLYIGVDFSKEAISIAQQSISDSTFFLEGDISNPFEINKAVLEATSYSLDSFCLTHCFVNHNFNPCEIDNNLLRECRVSQEHYLLNKRMISKISIKSIYIKHFENWRIYCRSFRLFLIELHSIDTININDSPAIGYEIFHYLSSQYILNFRDFLTVLKSAKWNIMSVSTIPSIDEPTISISELS